MFIKLPFDNGITWSLDCGIEEGKGYGLEMLVVSIQPSFLRRSATLRVYSVPTENRNDYLWAKFSGLVELRSGKRSHFATHEFFANLCGYFLVSQDPECGEEYEVAIPENQFLRVCGWLNSRNVELSASLVSLHDYDVLSPKGEEFSLVEPGSAPFLAFQITAITFSARFHNGDEVADA